MANVIATSKDIIYATQGNIGHPGTSADRTAANTRAAADANAVLGAGMTVSVAAVTAARSS
jgi:hypothetical protein